jgi:hypothetical protein
MNRNQSHPPSLEPSSAPAHLGLPLSIGWGVVGLLLAWLVLWRANAIGGARYLGLLDWLVTVVAVLAIAVCFFGAQGHPIARRLARKLAWIVFFSSLPLFLVAIGFLARSGGLLEGAAFYVPVFSVFIFAVVTMVKLNDDAG